MFVLREEVLICSSRNQSDAAGGTGITGYNWRVVAVVECTGLNDQGEILPNGSLKELLWKAVQPLDHRHLNDLQPFRISPGPTPPRVAHHIHGQLSALLAGSTVRLSEVSVWTSSTCCTTYRPEFG